MKCIYCNNEFTRADADNENMTPRWVNGECVPVHLECPEAEPVTFIYYVHSDDEEMAELLMSRGMDRATAEAIAEQRPFYELTLTCEFNPKTEEVKIVKVS